LIHLAVCIPSLGLLLFFDKLKLSEILIMSGASCLLALVPRCTLSIVSFRPFPGESGDCVSSLETRHFVIVLRTCIHLHDIYHRLYFDKNEGMNRLYVE